MRGWSSRINELKQLVPRRTIQKHLDHRFVQLLRHLTDLLCTRFIEALQFVADESLLRDKDVVAAAKKRGVVLEGDDEDE